MRSLIFFICWFALILSGCEQENMCDCVKSTGSIVSEKRSIGDFEKLEVRKNVIVTLVQDTVNYVEVEAGDHLIGLIKTEVENGILKITNDNTCNWVRSYDIAVRARVHLKKLMEIDHYGSEEISCENTLVTDFIDVYEYNSADIRLSLDAGEVFVREMVGGGDIYLSGHAHSGYCFGSSFGYIYANSLLSDSIVIDQRGTGDIHVHPALWLKVNIEDRGSVYYSGNPVVEAYLNGSGKLYHE
jgi:hypothetical protein